MAFDAFGRLALPNYQKFLPVVAEAYLARPRFQEAAVPAWMALRDSTNRLFRQMTRKIEVIFTDEDPYPDFAAMKDDIETQHRMLVWTGESSNSPIWTPEENWRFRAVHDYMIHLAGNHPFTLRGEIGAYNRHVKIAPIAARPALFTEIIGQTCAYLYLNKFAEQKICLLYGFDYVNVGLWDPVEYELNWDD